jgi:hypothetical protein
MKAINCYNIADFTCLTEQVSVSDLGSFNVKYLQKSILLSQYKFIARSQYSEHSASTNRIDFDKWLSEGSGHLKYEELLVCA